MTSDWTLTWAGVTFTAFLTLAAITGWTWADWAALPFLIPWIAAPVAEVRRNRRNTRKATAHATATSRVCAPCNGETGRSCTCTWRCGHPDCVGDHTTYSRAEVRGLEALLNKETGHG